MVGLHWSYLVLILPSMLFIGFLVWIEYKRSLKEKERKPDPFMRGLLVGFVIIILMLTVEMFGGFPSDTTKNYWWIGVIGTITTILVYLVVGRQKIPKSLIKQYEAVKKICKYFYNANEYTGVANISSLKVYKLTKEGKADDIRSEVGNFLVELEADKIRKYWVALNIYNLSFVHLQENPPIEIETRLMKTRIAPIKDETLKEFEEEEFEPKKKKEV